MIGLKLKRRCPRCGNLLWQDTDEREAFFVCVSCAREYNFDMALRHVTPEELYQREGIKRASREKDGLL